MIPHRELRRDVESDYPDTTASPAERTRSFG